MVELADTQDLGSCISDVRVQVPLTAPFSESGLNAVRFLLNKRLLWDLNGRIGSNDRYKALCSRN